MHSFYHLGFAVADLDRAMTDLGATVGLDWSPVRDGRLGDWDYRIVFSREGPPFYELIQGPAGSPWDTTGGSRLDHIGFWADDLAQAQRHLRDSGAPVDFDACPYGRPFSYHRLDSLGVRIELVDVAVQPGFLEAWQPDGRVMRPYPFGDPGGKN